MSVKESKKKKQVDSSDVKNQVKNMVECVWEPKSGRGVFHTITSHQYSTLWLSLSVPSLATPEHVLLSLFFYWFQRSSPIVAKPSRNAAAIDGGSTVKYCRTDQKADKGMHIGPQRLEDRRPENRRPHDKSFVESRKRRTKMDVDLCLRLQSLMPEIRIVWLIVFGFRGPTIFRFECPLKCFYSKARDNVVCRFQVCPVPSEEEDSCDCTFEPVPPVIECVIYTAMPSATRRPFLDILTEKRDEGLGAASDAG